MTSYDLADLCRLEQLAADLYVVESPRLGRERVYGGQVIAQALDAARRTVGDEHGFHSLHGYFIRPGDESRPIVLDVDRIRDGRSFTTRRVVARQESGAIFNLSASFHRVEPDVEFALPPADLDVPGPEECKPDEWPSAAEVRLVPDTAPGTAAAWVRLHPTRASADDPWLHVLAVAYTSDYIPMDAILAGHELSLAGHGFDAFMTASLDHALWYHRPARADAWMLHRQTLQSLQGSRGVAHGTIHDEDGTLVATVAQEGLIRPIRSGRP